MAKYVCLVKLQLKSFAAWKLEHIPRGSNEKLDALAALAASLPSKETILPPIYYQSESSIAINQVNDKEDTYPS